VVAIGFIGFIAIMNQPNKDAVYSGVYYMTDETVDIGSQAGSSWAALNSRQMVICPGLDNTIPTGTLINASACTTRANAYGIVYFPFTAESSNLNVKTLKKSNVYQAGISTTASAGTISDILSAGAPNLTWTNDADEEKTCYEILAPFAYNFESQNTDVSAPKEIIIVNKSKNCRMIVSNAANWFCAGTPGTATTYGTGNEDNCQWDEHYGHHQSILGKKSSVKSSGSAGELFAYGDESTTITFQVVKQGQWQTTSLIDVLTTATNTKTN
jgi:hypothetical protein